MLHKLRKGDKIVIGLVLILGVIAFAAVRIGFNRPYQGKYVIIRNLNDGKVAKLPLEAETQSVQVKGALGYSKIEVNDGKARIAHSPCPDQICVHVFGWISRDGEISVCLPNGVMLQIEDPAEE
ncbi:MAG: NusG domain II-containing protein [Firmicutes bacterium]|nr:NusG domain II-containing protein [Bacillota bacterium]